jgi:hypothetical protein
MASTSGENFVIEGAILSHPHLFKPEPFMQNGVPQGDPFYSTVLLITAEQANVINTKAYEVAQKHYKNQEYMHPSFGWPASPANLKPDYANNPRLAHLWMVNTKAGMEFPPQVVNENRQLVVDRGTIYAGCVVAAGLNCYTRPQPARPGEVGQGIGVGLQAVMKMADGEAIGGGSVDVKSLFAGVQAQSPSATAFTPPGGQPAPQQAMPNFGQPTQQANTAMPGQPFATQGQPQQQEAPVGLPSFMNQN